MTAAAVAAFDPDVEEALLRVYGVDPHRATLRRVAVLLRRLPPGTWHRDEVSSWTRESWMLADVVDAVNTTAWMIAAVNSKTTPQRPKPYPRPNVPTQPTRPANTKSWSAIAHELAEA